ncbi:MAG: bifunctional metallophosphatase/5'-nucleotidase [Gemmatimonadota bacterium]|nr:bifunctional metallophosphatase/5'-nucleotidase [Gemmatimonadota bacterium]
MISFALLCLSVLGAQEPARSVTLVHIGDVHGHLVPRPDLRAGAGKTVGGLARVAGEIGAIRAVHRDPVLLINTGDAVQGSAEALFTRGGALVEAMNMLGIDASTPGNWDYTYGTARFRETFVGESKHPPLANWHQLAANLHDGAAGGPAILPPYRLIETGGLRVGIIGLTTTRGVPIMGPDVTRGFVFSTGDAELPRLMRELREEKRADLIVVTSEQELANNIRLAETYPGVDVILSADMHERTERPIVTRNGTIIVEEGQDGAAVGELTLEVTGKRVSKWKWTSHVIGPGTPEDPAVARRVAELRAPFLRAAFNASMRNPVNGVPLRAPLDSVIGYTSVPLLRAAFSDEASPGVIEGSSHDFIADAMRAESHADVAILRGFRYGTQVAPGAITLGDLYHFLPIGGRVARVSAVSGAQLRDVIESCLTGVFDPDPRNWTGGWLHGFSGVTFDLDVSRPSGQRASNIRVGGKALDLRVTYSVAGFWFASEPRALNGCPTCILPAARVEPIAGEHGEVLDATDIVWRYLSSLPDRTARPVLGRIRLLRPLPAARYGVRVMQPLPAAQP